MVRTPRPGRSSLRGGRVLLVEDDIVHSLDISGTLTENGCRIVGPAFTLAAGFALLEDEAVDAAILDVMLFGELVFPLAIQLKQKNIPFLLVTADADGVLYPPEVRGAAKIRKPYAKEELVGALERAFKEPLGHVSRLNSKPRQSVAVGDGS
jgi:DNA-binding response OmpR family regulator